MKLKKVFPSETTEPIWFQTRRFLWEFPIGSYVKVSSAVAAILDSVLKCWTQFYKHNDELFNIYYGIFYEL
jgi:hypothetical protein